MREIAGIVVAAGSGVRFGGPLPKQFVEIGGRTIVERAVRCLAESARVGEVVVALPPGEIGGERARRVEAIPGVRGVVAGGATRAESVRNAVEASAPARHVLVHDAARPFAPSRVVEDVVDATLRHGAAIPAVEVPDTVKEADGEEFVAGTIDRRRLRLAQTPQGARTDWLLAALDLARREGFEPTDEAQALERAGRRVAIVPGDPANVKITSPRDFERAQRRAAAASCDLRVGTGFDAHRFCEGRPLVLGGVAFPEERLGLEGHSDADAVLHAAMDALLGAAALGDIGVLFPPGDPRFAGAASGGLAARVAERVRESGFEIVNVDLTVLAERPRIAARAAAMREAIAACLGIGADRVGLKATTLEGMGALGREEGIACQAVALVRRRSGDEK